MILAAHMRCSRAANFQVQTMNLDAIISDVYRSLNDVPGSNFVYLPFGAKNTTDIDQSMMFNS